ncbi:MAG: hypothetical protein ACLP9L_01525 [Thermoguttaceae bacterium]
MFSRLSVIGSICIGLLSSGAAKAVDRTDVEEAKLQVALAQVGVQMAMVNVKKIRVKVEALEQAVSKGQAMKTDLEMAKLEIEAAELNVKAAEINVARANLVVERAERALKAGETKASSKKAAEGKARKESATAPSVPIGPISEAKARELAMAFVDKAKQDWGQPTEITKQGDQYQVSFKTDETEMQVLGPRAVFVDASTGKCWFPVRE